jgi:hypothetical protein
MAFDFNTFCFLIEIMKESVEVESNKFDLRGRFKDPVSVILGGGQTFLRDEYVFRAEVVDQEVFGYFNPLLIEGGA